YPPTAATSSRYQDFASRTGSIRPIRAIHSEKTIVMADPILDEIWRVREELVKKHGDLDGYFAYIQKLDRSSQRRRGRPGTKKTPRRAIEDLAASGGHSNDELAPRPHRPGARRGPPLTGCRQTGSNVQPLCVLALAQLD